METEGRISDRETEMRWRKIEKQRGRVRERGKNE
jgi:hypothetical protein